MVSSRPPDEPHPGDLVGDRRGQTRPLGDERVHLDRERVRGGDDDLALLLRLRRVVQRGDDLSVSFDVGHGFCVLAFQAR